MHVTTKRTNLKHTCILNEQDLLTLVKVTGRGLNTELRITCKNKSRLDGYHDIHNNTWFKHDICR